MHLIHGHFFWWNRKKILNRIQILDYTKDIDRRKKEHNIKKKKTNLNQPNQNFATDSYPQPIQSPNLFIALTYLCTFNHQTTTQIRIREKGTSNIHTCCAILDIILRSKEYCLCCTWNGHFNKWHIKIYENEFMAKRRQFSHRSFFQINSHQHTLNAINTRWMHMKNATRRLFSIKSVWLWISANYVTLKRKSILPNENVGFLWYKMKFICSVVYCVFKTNSRITVFSTVFLWLYQLIHTYITS